MHSSYYAVLALALMPVLAAQPARAQNDPAIHMVTYIDVAPAAKDQAAALLKPLAEASRKDAGNLLFQILQRTAPAHQFVILATWKDQQALDAHDAAAHSKQFRGQVEPHLIAPIDDRLCVPTFVAAQISRQVLARLGDSSVYVVTHVDVPGNVRDKILPALEALAEQSRKEAGNLRFDVSYQKTRTNHFTVMENWKDQAANDTHELAAHTRAFRGMLTPITGALYDQRWYKSM
jgi:quinol monooxygenase YgiN